MRSARLMALFGFAAMMGGIPMDAGPRRRAKLQTKLPEGFKKWYFNKSTGELLDSSVEDFVFVKTEVFVTTSRSEEVARSHYEKAKKKRGW